MMSFVLAHSDPIIPHATSSPYSVISSNASAASSIPRRPHRPSLRSTKTDSGGVSETIPEADEHQSQPAQSSESSSSISATSPSFQRAHNSASSLAFSNHHQHNHSSSNCQQLASLSNRGLDLDHLLGPRRTSVSSSLRDDQKTAHHQSAHSSSSTSPKSLLQPLVSHSGQIFYSSSPSTPWVVSSQSDHPSSEATPNLDSPRPRSSTTSSVPSVPSPVDPVDQHYQFASKPSSATSQAQFVSPRSSSTTSFPSSLLGCASSSLSNQPTQQLHTAPINPQPAVTLRPRADSYNHPATWKAWSSNRTSCGPLDYIPNREAATERKSWMIPSLNSQAHQIHASTGDVPPAVIPRSHSLHDLHGSHDPVQLRNSHGLGGFGPLNQLSASTRAGINPSLASTLYSEPGSAPRMPIDQQSLSYQSSDPRPSSYPELGSRSSLSEGPFATPATSAPRLANRGDPVAEEISTIFVVGFPDDMNEREFQNMFMFCNGFEAATLKVPASTLAARERDITAAVVAAAAAAAGNPPVRSASAAGFGPSTPAHRLAGIQAQQGGIVIDQFGMPIMGIEGFDDVYQNALGLESQFINARPHPLGIATPMVPGCLGAPNLQGILEIQAGATVPGNRKQIIGFAKFKTRADALQARDVLSGRKVDAEKGNILKAEMAKKNLHTKRGLSNEIAVIVAPNSSSTTAPVTSSVSHVGSESIPTAPLPPTPCHELGSEKMSPGTKENLKPDVTLTAAPGSSENSSERGRAMDLGLDSWHNSGSAVGPRDRNVQPRRSTLGGPENAYASSFRGSETELSQALTSVAPPEWSETPSPVIEASLGKSLWEKLEEDSEGVVGSSSPVDNSSHDSNGGAKVEGNCDGSGAMLNRGSGSTNPKPNTCLQGWSGPSPRNHYPADQNPAINTLYVGGLPMVVENVGDVGIAPGLMMMSGMMMMRSEELESGLRKVFGRTEGFKRLSYKVKNQQPMCFVEFETVEQASAVMERMYGDKIEGKVPSGIRLAYSRNALGVRSAGSSCSSVNSATLGVGNLAV